MNKDNYGEIINGEDTFKKIAFRLYNGQSVLIGWTDEGCDHRDILFTYDADVNEGISHTLIKAGENIQRGMRWSNFFVSIIDFTSFGFTIEDLRDNRKHKGYLQEKLRLHDNSCDDKICELINGIIHELDILEGNVKNE